MVHDMGICACRDLAGLAWFGPLLQDVATCLVVAKIFISIHRCFAKKR